MALMWLKGPGDWPLALALLFVASWLRGSRYHPLRPSTLLVGMKDGQDPGPRRMVNFHGLAGAISGESSSESHKNLGMA